MMELIRKLMPTRLMAFYHKTLALLANFFYGRPSEELVVIGVTGTNGKTTTVALIAKIFEVAGFKIGAASTALFKIGEKEWLNDQKMTMLGRFALQKLLRQMVKAGCQYAVIETSSQGIEQFRHLGIHYDIGVFTNLTPEHIEAHGGFDNYKAAKLKLFKHLENQKNKQIKDQAIKKIIVINGDDQYAPEFLGFKVDRKIIYSIKDYELRMKNEIFKPIQAKNIDYQKDGLSFEIKEVKFDLKLFGRFNVYNSLAAIAVARSQGISLATAKSALEKVSGVPGRLEFIETSEGFRVLVDYAPEPESLRQLFETIKMHNLAGGGRIIHVFGSCGGGRDAARRPVLGQISAANASIAIITNEDPYNDDPALIIDQVAQGAISRGMVLGQNLFKISDRREAIAKALDLARSGDLVLLTGKGSEQAICVAAGRKIPWDEREVARVELKKLVPKNQNEQ